MKELEKEILEEVKSIIFTPFKENEEFETSGWIINKVIKDAIQLTQSKTIQIIDKRIKELKHIRRFQIGKYRCIEPIQELQSLKKELLEKEKGGIITIHSVEVVNPEFIAKHMFPKKIPKGKEEG